MLSLIFLLLIGSPLVQGCLITRVTSPESGHYFQIRNFDFPLGGDDDGLGHLVINPRGYQRSSLRKLPGDNPANWTSTYGSVTFNLLGENFPQGGLNERGLAMQVTVLQNMFFPYFSTENHNLQTINEMDIIQYVLDQASSVDEAIRLLEHGSLGRFSFSNPLRLTILSEVIDKERGQVLNFHWGMCDASGECALVEYLYDHFEYQRFPRNSLSPFIVTNNDEGSLLVEWNRLNALNLPIPQDLISRSSLSRYANARYFVEHSDVLMAEYNASNFQLTPKSNEIQSIHQEEIAPLFYLLDRSTKHSWNKWQTVFDLNNRMLYYRTRPSLVYREFNLTQLNFTKSLPESYSLHASPRGECARWGWGCLDQSLFFPADLDQMHNEFRTVSDLLEQPVEWGEVVMTDINETRQVNLGLDTWHYRSVEECSTPPSRWEVMRTKAFLGLRVYYNRLWRRFVDPVLNIW